MTWTCQGGLSVCAVPHRAGRGKPGRSDAVTNTPLLQFGFTVTQIRYPMQWLVKQSKKEQCFQVAFTKNSQQNPS